MLSIKYSDEKFIEDPPSEEQLRFAVHEFNRMRESTISRPKPVVVNPEVKEPGTQDIPTPAERQTSKGCFNRGSTAHWQGDCPFPQEERCNRQLKSLVEEPEP